MKSPSTNEFRHRLDFQTSTITVDTYGQPTRVWSTVQASVPAKLEIKTNKKAWIADQESAEFEYVFTVRYRTVYFDSQRISFNNELYSIHSIADKVGLRKHLEIIARKVSTPGSTI